MKKLLFVSIIGLAFCAFVPNTSFAGNPLKDLSKIGQAPDVKVDKKPAKSKPAKSKPAKVNRSGNRSNKEILERLEALEIVLEIKRLENVHSGNINEYLLPFWVVLVFAILLSLLGIGLTIKSLLLGNTVRSNKNNVSALTNRVNRTAPPGQQNTSPSQPTRP